MIALKITHYGRNTSQKVYLLAVYKQAALTKSPEKVLLEVLKNQEYVLFLTIVWLNLKSILQQEHHFSL